MVFKVTVVFVVIICEIPNLELVILLVKEISLKSAAEKMQCRFYLWRKAPFNPSVFCVDHVMPPRMHREQHVYSAKPQVYARLHTGLVMSPVSPAEDVLNLEIKLV